MSGIIAQNSGRHTGLVKASSGGGGVWNLIKTYTASSDSTLSFVDGTDGVDFTAYDEYVFKFNNIHPSGEGFLTFQANASGGSGYNETITSTSFQSFHTEDDTTVAAIGYVDDDDQANGTAFQRISSDCGNQNDASYSGELLLFGLSSTTHVKHFIARAVHMYEDAVVGAITRNVAGYFNTTSAIDEIQFKFESGDIDAGSISLFGIT